MDETPPTKNVVSTFFQRLGQRYQLLLGGSVRDTKSLVSQRMNMKYKSTPHTKARWIGAFVNLGLFLTRIITAQGWYIVTYALGIYHLNLFIAFLTPKIDPGLDLDSADDADGPALPTRSNEEFRPFIRRLPEFKFWYAITKSTTIALVCTFFDVFNVPVFWPILVMYFITLFCITMKRQIRHMIKHRYLPFTHSKPKYQSAEVTIK